MFINTPAGGKMSYLPIVRRGVQLELERLLDCTNRLGLRLVFRALKNKGYSLDLDVYHGTIKLGLMMLRALEISDIKYQKHAFVEFYITDSDEDTWIMDCNRLIKLTCSEKLIPPQIPIDEYFRPVLIEQKFLAPVLPCAKLKNQNTSKCYIAQLPMELLKYIWKYVCFDLYELKMSKIRTLELIRPLELPKFRARIKN